MDQKFTKDLSLNEKQIDKYVYNFKDGKLGHGSYGTVYLGYNVQTKEEVAIKLVKKVNLKDKDDEKQLMQEIQIMENLKGPNIVNMIDVLQTENNYYMIMEYCNNGDLDHLLFKSNSINHNDHYKFLIDILQAFIELIKQGIIHRDLKPANILVSRVGNVRTYKLGDFGFARSLKSSEMLDSKVGTPLYMSPQILDEQKYTSKSDIWSLAFIMYQFIYLKTPWNGRTEDELLFRIINMPLQFPSSPQIPDLAKEFIIGCLKVKEIDRFSWDQLYRHPYVAKHFSQYIEISRNLENKVSYLLSSLRGRVIPSSISQLFKDLDTSGDCVLNLEEFAQLMWKLDQDLDMREVQLVFDEIDQDCNGQIDYNEFRKAFKLDEKIVIKRVPEVKEHYKVYEVLTKLYDAKQKYKINLFQFFNKYDVSRNGSLDRSELAQLLEKIDNTISEKEIETTLNVFDENGDGEIQYNEFKKVFDDIGKSRVQSTLIKISPTSSKSQEEVRRYFEHQISSKKIESEKDIGSNQVDEVGHLDFIQNSNGLLIIPMMMKPSKQKMQRNQAI